MVMNMKINRLLEIIIILLSKETITAKELAEHFGVSTRTIYRDIEILSLSNIPIYTNKGSGGGISILEQFTMDRSLLSGKEQSDIIAALHSLKATKYPEIDNVILKLTAIFKNVDNYNWVEVDFSNWGNDSENKSKFNSLKSAILNYNIVGFDYVNSQGQKTSRSVEPIKLVFKSQAWYLQGFCQEKQEIRIFKISRLRNLVVSRDTFQHSHPREAPIESLALDVSQTVDLRLRFKPQVLYRVYDEF